MRLNAKRSRAGFTLIELLVVVLIIGILAAIAVPQYYKVVERGKVTEAMQWLSGLKGTQERYLVKNGAYCISGTVPGCVFDVNLGILKYFAAPTLAVGTGSPSWKVVLTRQAPLPATYGAYGLTWDSGAVPMMSCDNTDCTTDLLP